MPAPLPETVCKTAGKETEWPAVVLRLCQDGTGISLWKKQDEQWWYGSFDGNYVQNGLERIHDFEIVLILK